MSLEEKPDEQRPEMESVPSPEHSETEIAVSLVGERVTSIQDK
jgi:hypothetical protein